MIRETMIKELLLTSLLQAGDLLSTNYALSHNPNTHETNPLMIGRRKYITSAVVVAGETFALCKTHGKTKLVFTIGLTSLKSAAITINIRNGK